MAVVRMSIGVAVLASLAGCAAEYQPENEKGWEEAVAVLNTGQVTSVAQAHDLWVSFHSRDGTSFEAREPEIDWIFGEVEACGKCPDDMIVATE